MEREKKENNNRGPAGNEDKKTRRVGGKRGKGRRKKQQREPPQRKPKCARRRTLGEKKKYRPGRRGVKTDELKKTVQKKRETRKSWEDQQTSRQHTIRIQAKRRCEEKGIRAEINSVKSHLRKDPNEKLRRTERNRKKTKHLAGKEKKGEEGLLFSKERWAMKDSSGLKKARREPDEKGSRKLGHCERLICLGNERKKKERGEKKKKK